MTTFLQPSGYHNPALNGLVMIGMMYVTDGDKAAVQRWIDDRG
jgi:hypothetical protein